MKLSKFSEIFRFKIDVFKLILAAKYFYESGLKVKSLLMRLKLGQLQLDCWWACHPVHRFGVWSFSWSAICLLRCSAKDRRYSQWHFHLYQIGSRRPHPYQRWRRKAELWLPCSKGSLSCHCSSRRQLQSMSRSPPFLRQHNRWKGRLSVPPRTLPWRSSETAGTCCLCQSQSRRSRSDPSVSQRSR